MLFSCMYTILTMACARVLMLAGDLGHLHCTHSMWVYGEGCEAAYVSCEECC